MSILPAAMIIFVIWHYLWSR